MSNIKLEKSETNIPEKRPIDVLFGSITRVDTLWQFLIRPDEWMGPSVLSRLTGRNLKGIQREIKNLWMLGLLKPKILHGSGLVPDEGMKREWQNPWKLNAEHPWVPALRMLLENAIGSIDILRTELSKLDGIRVAFIYGSFASSMQTPESDIDLIVIGGHTLKSLASPISKIEKRVGRAVDFTAYSVETWRRLYEEKSHFVFSLMPKPKVFIVGDHAKLERLTAGTEG